MPPMTEPPERIRMTFDVATQAQEAELHAAWQEIIAGERTPTPRPKKRTRSWNGRVLAWRESSRQSKNIPVPAKPADWCAFSPASSDLHGLSDQEVQYQAPSVPGLARLRVTITQREVTATAEALITVTDSLVSAIAPAVVNTRGLPGYIFERAAGELWRCRFDAERNIIVVNSGHRDFVFATRNRALQLRYLVRLYVKELVLKNFAGLPADQLLERMIELSQYAEEKLKSG
jgi:hypothetical protein